MNIKEFDNNTDIFDKKASGLIVIYLEGPDDLEIFDRWFYSQYAHMAEFKYAGGCQQVFDKVIQDRNNDITSYGIVDRDTLLRNSKWTELMEYDDTKYQSYQPFGPFIKILCRWEIENFLLDPESVEEKISSNSPHYTSPRRPRNKTDIIKEFGEHCHALVPLMAYNFIAHFHKMSALKMTYGLSLDRNKMKEALKNKINKELPSVEENRLDDKINQIEKFSNSKQFGSEEYFERLNRIIDGKRIFARLWDRHKLKSKLPYEQGVKSELAIWIREKKCIDNELTNLIEEMLI